MKKVQSMLGKKVLLMKEKKKNKNASKKTSKDKKTPNNINSPQKKKDKKFFKLEKNNKKDDLSTSSSSSSETTKGTAAFIAFDNSFLEQQKKNLPGALSVPYQGESYTQKLLVDDRPDIDISLLTKAEAMFMDQYLRDKNELVPGDCLYTEDNNNENDRCFIRYEIQIKYNEGRYAAIYLATRSRCIKNNIITDPNKYFIVKTALRKNSGRSKELLKNEGAILQDVGNNRFDRNKLPFTPIRIEQGLICDMPYLVMSYLDTNLAKLREDCGGTFTLATAIYAAIETLNVLAHFHAKNYIHRDVKPTNFCAGLQDMSHRLFLIDFGDAMRNNDRSKELGVPDDQTLPYWSIEAHTTGTVSRLGDLESWFYMAVELIKPNALIWLREQKIADVLTKKKAFWSDYKKILCTKSLLFTASMISEKEFAFPKDYQVVKQKLLEEHEFLTIGTKWTVDWLKVTQAKSTQFISSKKKQGENK